MAIEEFRPNCDGGLTELFGEWKHGKEVLHYFDNLPTAAVATRARRLREYLAKRIARGEIFTGDDITLVGHSTGGLDIRFLLRGLSKNKKPILIEGGKTVNPDDLRRLVHRVVFLSVPHWGTNIADWVQDHWIGRRMLIDDLRATVAGSQFSLMERVESAIAFNAANMTDAAFFQAIQDALDEANEDNGEQSPHRKAEAHEAASELALYLRHMASDFRAIDDLTSRRPPISNRLFRETLSPANYSEKEREAELRELQKPELQEIEFLSYVTIGRRPFRFEAGKSAPTWEFSDPRTYPNIFEVGGSSSGTDAVYRVCYRACAGGPFEPPNENRKLAKRMSPKETIEVWDNDGIVNTLSMFWPLGKNVLVHGDHMDIVGQYTPVRAPRGQGRKYLRYDLLKSDSGFTDENFNEVWSDIFAFALGRTSSKLVVLIGDNTYNSDWVEWEINTFYEMKEAISSDNTWKRIRGMTLKGSDQATIPNALMNGRSTQWLAWNPEALDKWLDIEPE